MTSNNNDQLEAIEHYADKKLQEAHMKYLRQKYLAVFQEYYQADHETSKSLKNLQKSMGKLRNEVDLSKKNNIINLKSLEIANMEAQKSIEIIENNNIEVDREITAELKPTGYLSLILSVLALIGLFIVIFVKI
ncbi:hypothetical protein TRFO_37601 [Tritrichomonas foetus]|uniref:Uncharacterized protein n=1 Tax=Tritrichomonas foetus TaxID=1144522 RepID=A0A1J4JFK6_9EUKA|nr:hypothetical protein TRFO_37601 [Tritrichomonas foetus]|eukprot:OHS96245.1 hypothetical protein TRFO_37601 [Tritrichomonas foetus]